MQNFSFFPPTSEAQKQQLKQSPNHLEEYSTDSTYSSGNNELMDINRFLNLEENPNNFIPKIEEDYENQAYDQAGLFFQPIQQPIMNHTTYPNVQKPSSNTAATANYSKISQQLDKSKRIMKREKAKNRKQIQEQQALQNIKIEDVSSSHIESFESNKSNANPGEQKQQKKMLQMIRNRISAQNSRDRKKAYIHQLEGKTKELNSMNQMLQKKVEELMNQNQTYRTENIDIRKQLEQLRKKVGQSGTEDFFQEPQVNISNRSKTNFTALGLALFSIVSIFMVLSSNVPANKDSNFLLATAGNLKSKLDLSNQNQLEIAFQKLEEMSSEYQMLKQVDKIIEEEVILEESTQEEQVIPESQLVKLNTFLPIEQKPENCSTGLTNLDFNQNSQNQIQTIFCPSPYKLQTEAAQGQYPVKFQNNEWIQLIVPKDEFKFFNSDKSDNIFVGTQKIKEEEPQSKKLLEIWAKVQSVREYNANQLSI